MTNVLRRNDGTYFRVAVMTAILVSAVAATSKPASAQTENVLYSFGNAGSHPQSSLIMDASGNLYGTTEYGGAYGGGTAFELSVKPGGGHNLTVLHSFGGPDDGYAPYAGLILDTAGNLYGTTVNGGSANGNNGVVFMLTRTQGVWRERVLHAFSGGASDGSNPWAGLIFRQAG